MPRFFPFDSNRHCHGLLNADSASVWWLRTAIRTRASHVAPFSRRRYADRCEPCALAPQPRGWKRSDQRRP